MWATPGFKRPARDMRETLVPEDDFYALGMLLACALIAVSHFSLSIQVRCRGSSTSSSGTAFRLRYET